MNGTHDRLHPNAAAFTFLFSLLLCGPLHAQLTTPDTDGQHRQNIAGALNPDGSIRRGADGAYLTDGYVMQCDAKTGEPRFAPSRTASTGLITWHNTFGAPNGTNGTIFSAAFDGSTYYVGGSFTTANGSTARHIARWDGRQLVPMGSGANGDVCAIVVSNGIVYAGGFFTDIGGVAANYVAQWDGSQWSPLGMGITTGSCVRALAVDGNGYLYVGGEFTRVDYQVMRNVALWDPASAAWYQLGMNTYGTNGPVNAIAIDANNVVYVGGSFTAADGNTALGVAQFDWNTGGTWSNVGPASYLGTGPVYAIACVGQTVYIGGGFNGSPTPGNYVAQFDTQTGQWTTIGSLTAGPSGTVNAILPDDSGNVYFAGQFTYIGGSTPARCIAKWNGSSWSAVQTGLSAVAYCLARVHDTLYCGGSFSTAANGTLSANFVAAYDRKACAWSSVGNGLNSYVFAIAVQGADFYIGGYFTSVWNKPMAGIAKWSGSSKTWQALGGGLQGKVYAIALDGNTVYAGGTFTTADGSTTVNRVAKFDGTSWSALGSVQVGTSGTVYALAHDGSSLYVGGDFTTAGAVTVNNIARYANGTWYALGTTTVGTSGPVRAILCTGGGGLYAGGDFTTAGGVTVNNIAQFSAGAWHELDAVHPGTDGSVRALAMSSGGLLAGGMFTTAGGQTVNHIALWNGAQWSPLGNPAGVNGDVHAIACSGANVYIGGMYTLAGGSVPCHYITHWSAAGGWSSVGNGVAGTVYALAVRAIVPKSGALDRTQADGQMLLGGSFTAVDYEALGASFIAAFTNTGAGGDPLPVEITSFTARLRDVAVHLRWTTATECNNHAFTVQRREESTTSEGEVLLSPWADIATIPGAGTSSVPREYAHTDHITDAGRTATTLQYRLRQTDRDGSAHFSQIVTIACPDAGDILLDPPYPNPGGDHAETLLRVRKATTASVALLDARGRMLTGSAQYRSFGPGYHVLRIPRGGIPAGVSFLVVQTQEVRRSCRICFVD